MKNLHIVQGGITNGDKTGLEKASRQHLNLERPKWVAPKGARIGDEVVIFVGGQFFATAVVNSPPVKRKDWPGHRYGVKLAAIRLIEKPISIDEIRRRWPSLGWAKYPRSIYTVRTQQLADQIRKVVYAS